MAYAALMSLRTIIQDLELSSYISISPISLPILTLAFEAAESFREALQLLDGTCKSYSRKDVNALDERIKEVVWRFEDLLESHVYDQILGGGAVVEVQLDEMRDDIESFIKMLEEFEKEYMYELDHLSPEEDVEVVSSSIADSGVKNCKMVGSFNEIWGYFRCNLREERSSDVIALSGMGGVGKTAIAKIIFNDPLVCTGLEFECRAWVTIGRKWQPHKLIRDIIIQLENPSEEAEMNEGYLKGILEAKRCLIVLDDVWDKEVWDLVKSCLPTYIAGRTLILLTVRSLHVSRYAESTTLSVRLLTYAKSWDLLRQKVFGEEGSCPPELEQAGKKIARKCDGLPLMIIAVADNLRQAEMTEEYWESVAEKNNSSIFMDAYDRVSKVLFPSYEYLPQNLKPCFLYMGVFCHAQPVYASWLLIMWMAEGFLLSSENETIEECFDRYFEDIFLHSVVILCLRISNFYSGHEGRRIKSHRLQSCFWHLCKREVTYNKFFHILSTLDDVEKSMINTPRRLSFHNNMLLGIKNLSDSLGDACASTARSLIFLGSYQQYQVPICFRLRLLKVLVAYLIRFYEFPNLVFQLVYLRYLALTCNNKLPASISKLWNLRSLIMLKHIIIKHSGVISYMPIEIWQMKRLKHLQVESNLPNPNGDVSLESLLTLKDVGVETCTKEVFERIPNLKKLGIEVHLHPSDDDDMKALHCLNHVHVLSELTSLTCKVWNPIMRSKIFALPMLPSSLKKLHLSGTGYPWSYMSVIGSLPQLRVLKLRSYAFRGSEWVVKYGQFEKLQVLQIYEADLVKLKVEAPAFVGLQLCNLSHCYKLRDIQWEPDEDVNIIVFDCSSSTVAFANKYELHEGRLPGDPRSTRITSSYMK